jgi:hypothetical protein
MLRIAELLPETLRGKYGKGMVTHGALG